MGDRESINTGNDAQQNFLIRLLRHLITTEVTPKGEKTASSLGLGFLGTGMMMGCTNEARTLDRARDELKMELNAGASWAAHDAIATKGD